jgi:MFS family permease
MFGWFASMNMQMLVRGFIVFDLTGSYAALGIVSLANAIPGMILSLPGGVLADRLEKKTVIQVGQAANMLLCAVIAFLLLSDLLIFEHLVAGAVFQGMINAMIMPARQSMIPEIVEEDRLMNAVALNSAAMNVMRLVAPGLGGLLLATLGPGWVYVSMAALYAGGALFLFPVRKAAHALDPARIAADRERHKGGGVRDLVEGVRYMKRDRIVLMILMVNLMIVLFSMPFQMILPGFVKEVLDAGPGRLGLLMSLTGVGSLAGSLLIASMPPRNRGLVLLLSSLLLGISLIAFSASTWFWVTAAIMVIIGVGQAGRMSLGNVLLQSYTDREYRGRVMSVYLLEFSLTSFATFFVGVLANFLGVQMAIGATAVGLVGFIVLTLLFLPRMRRLD